MSLPIVATSLISWHNSDFFLVSCLPLQKSVIWSPFFSNSLEGTVVLSEALGVLVSQHWACALWWVHPRLSTAWGWTQTDMFPCSHCSHLRVCISEFRSMLPCVTEVLKKYSFPAMLFFYSSVLFLFLWTGRPLWTSQWTLDCNNISLSYYMCLILFSF